MGKANKQVQSKMGSKSQEPTPVEPQPSKAKLEADVSLPVNPERLMRAVVTGGAARRKKPH